LCFTNRGQLYWIRVYELPEQSRTAQGRALANFMTLKPDEKITSVIPVRSFDEPGRCLMMATRRGLVKKTALEDYSRVRAGGIIGINLEEGDTLIDVVMTTPGNEVVLSTRKGMAIRFDEANVRTMGRNTKGVKGIKLTGDDEVVGMVVADPEGFLLTVCENGYGKRTLFGANQPLEAAEAGEETAEEMEEEEHTAEDSVTGEEGGEEEGGRESSQKYYRKQRRGGKGVRDIRTSERNGPVVGIVAVRETDDIMLITVGGMVNRTHAREISVVGRNTQGVRVMGLKEGDKIASLAKIAPEEVEEAAAAEEAPAQS
jgi:DNA gyrase subunit A